MKRSVKPDGGGVVPRPTQTLDLRQAARPPAIAGLNPPAARSARRPQVVRPAKPTPPAAPRPDQHLARQATSYGLVVLVASVIGLLSLDASIGQWIIGAAGLTALLLRFDSRYLFILALFELALVPLFLVLNKPGLAENYAIYAYYWLVFGVVAAMLELRRDRGHRS